MKSPYFLLNSAELCWGIVPCDTIVIWQYVSLTSCSVGHHARNINFCYLSRLSSFCLFSASVPNNLSFTFDLDGERWKERPRQFCRCSQYPDLPLAEFVDWQTECFTVDRRILRQWKCERVGRDPGLDIGLSFHLTWRVTDRTFLSNTYNVSIQVV